MKLTSIFKRNADGKRPYAVAFSEAAGCATWLCRRHENGKWNIASVAAALPRAYLRKSFAVALISAAFLGASSGAMLSFKQAAKDVRQEHWQDITARLEQPRKNAQSSFTGGFIPQLKHDLVKSYQSAEFAPYMLRGVLLAFCLTFAVPPVAIAYGQYRGVKSGPA